MRLIIVTGGIAAALLLAGCAQPQPEVVLEPIAQSAPVTNASIPAPQEAPAQKPVTQSDGPFISDTLRSYYAAARAVGQGQDRSEFDAASRTLQKQIEGQEADVNQPDPHGIVPMMVAVQSNDAEMTARLLRAGANAEALSPQGLPLLSLALQEGTLEKAGPIPTWAAKARPPRSPSPPWAASPANLTAKWR